MAKKRYQNSKKITSGTGHKDEPVKAVKAIIVLFTLDSLKKICRDTHTTLAVYGRDVALADTMAMDKIITALAKGESRVII